HDRAEAFGLRLPLLDKVELQLVEPFQIEAQAALLAVDLKQLVVLAPGRQPRSFQGANRPVFELDSRDKSVVHVNLTRAAAVGQRALIDKGPGHGTDAPDLADEEAAEIDNVGGEVADGAGARLLAVHTPEARRVVVR